MGKPTGFMEYDREEARAFSAEERIKNFNEFHEPLSREEQKRQGARCMECGVPFCQSGMMLGGISRVHLACLSGALRKGVHLRRKRRRGDRSPERVRDR